MDKRVVISNEILTAKIYFSECNKKSSVKVILWLVNKCVAFTTTALNKYKLVAGFSILNISYCPFARFTELITCVYSGSTVPIEARFISLIL